MKPERLHKDINIVFIIRSLPADIEKLFQNCIIFSTWALMLYAVSGYSPLHAPGLPAPGSPALWPSGPRPSGSLALWPSGPRPSGLPALWLSGSLAPGSPAPGSPATSPLLTVKSFSWINILYF